MIRNLKCLLSSSLLCATLCSAAHGRTLYVDATRGDDRSSGGSRKEPLRTIQQAAKVVEPGDEVVIGPGVYFERITLKRKGREGQSIIFRADDVAKHRVTITSADRRLRTEHAAWTREAGAVGLYSAEYGGEMPSRVLYSGVDLFPYSSLEQLRTFRTPSGLAPQHGYYYGQSAHRLYVRLHAGERYGSADPKEHVMSVSPGEGVGFAIRGIGPAHVVLDGLTFETPGDAGVLTEGSFVEVRRCWFVGCPYGVRGTRRDQPPDDGVDGAASHVTISHCEFTEHAAFEDAEELLALANVSAKKPATWVEIWHRKTSGERGLPADRKNFENGLAVLIGDRWDIHHNHIHDGFEGLANDGLNWATNLKVHHNVFARLCDNAVEVENHAKNVDVYRNVVRDVFEAFSYQPLAGPPWPSGIIFRDNVIINTPEHARRWRYAPHGTRGAFKIGISPKNWEEGYCPDLPMSPLSVPSPGMAITGNTVLFRGGRLISIIGDRSIPLGNVRFARNVFASDVPIAGDSPGRLQRGYFAFRENVALPPDGAVGAEESRLTAGDGGQLVNDAAKFWRTVQAFREAAEKGRGRGEGAELDSIGAISSDADWLPLKVGPLMTADLTTLQSLDAIMSQ